MPGVGEDPVEQGLNSAMGKNDVPHPHCLVLTEKLLFGQTGCLTGKEAAA